jgi:hypothetical protein
MIRKFKFEDEIYRSLSCLPMAARRKLDTLGIKIGLAQWEQLGRGERLMICHAPIASDDEREALRMFIAEATARNGSAPKPLPDEARQSASPPAQPPALLIRNARAAGVALGDTAWAAMDDDQRYVLMKLGNAEKPSHKFAAALSEFIAPGRI